MNEELKFEVTDGVALITLNRPDAYNSISAAILEGIGEAYKRCDEDDDIRVAVVTGAGNIFCAGADMSGGGSTFDSGAQSVEVDSCPLSMQAWEVRKPVIAACNGHAVGAGLGLAVQTDMRVFATEGKYGFLQARRGVVTDFAMEYVLPRLVGFERAFE
jgi:enoyl-CoA hydratase/carnithine racemase